MTTSPKRILLVEDDRFLRKACQAALAQRGYTVLTAADGEEGLARARAERPDLILLDMLMPKLSGLEVLQALRADAATRDLRVLVLSNSSLDRTVQAAESLGAGYFVKANLSLQALGDHVADALEGRLVFPPLPAAERD
jgi:CheY-like chemotaxis protein